MESDSASLLATHDLVVGINGNPIGHCDDVHLKPGDVLVLIGRNGAGKSTFLRTVGGLLKPISGEISFGGQSHRMVSMEKMIAWLSQEEHFEFSWTVREYVGLGRIAHNAGLYLSREDQERIDDALRQADAVNLSQRLIHELSGGERQRIRIARALAQDTPLILMDEPTTHLDLEHQMQVLNLIRKLSNNGKSVVVSIHDPVQAKLIGNQFMLFQGQRAHWVEGQSGLTKEMLEATLQVRFEQIGDQLLPQY